MKTERMIDELQSLLQKRGGITKRINSLMDKIAVATNRPLPDSEENPLDYADEIIGKTLIPSIPFIHSGGQLIMSEDHKAHRHEYTIRLIVDFQKQ